MSVNEQNGGTLVFQGTTGKEQVGQNPNLIAEKLRPSVKKPMFEVLTTSSSQDEDLIKQFNDLREDIGKLLRNERIEYPNVVKYVKITYSNDESVKYFTSKNTNVDSNTGALGDTGFNLKEFIIKEFKKGLSFEQLLLLPDNSEIQIEYKDGETTVADKFTKISNEGYRLVTVKKDPKNYTVSQRGTELVLTEDSNNSSKERKDIKAISSVKYLNISTDPTLKSTETSPTNGVETLESLQQASSEPGPEPEISANKSVPGKYAALGIDPSLVPLYEIINETKN